jgi:HSP20 family protein
VRRIVESEGATGKDCRDLTEREATIMSSIPVKRVAEETLTLPVFEELDRRMEKVRRRAYDLFAERGFEPGHDLDDWLAAENEVLGWPAAELVEKDGEFEMDLTLPGFEGKDIEVIAEPASVTVHASVEKKAGEKHEHIVWSEFGKNEVFRKVTFPADIELPRVTAEFANGLLRVYAPKATPKVGKETKVPITTP